MMGSDDEDGNMFSYPQQPHNMNQQPMNMSHTEPEIATQHDIYSSQPMMNSEEESLLMNNPNVKPILPWAKLISKCKDCPSFELMDQPPDNEGRYNVYTLGRSSQCGIKFDTPRISNRHCIIYCKMNNTNPAQPYLEAYVEDCSANGTFINNKIKLKKGVPRLLHTGDDIGLLNPALLQQANTDVTEEDFLKNTFHVMLNLPHQNKANGLSSSKSLKSQMITKSLEDNFGRSNTVIRLLKQQRNIYDFYEIRELLGTGTSGEVYRGIKKDTGRDWAVKVINLRKLISHGGNNNSNLMNEMIANTAVITKEAEMLRSLRHPNIVHLEDIFSDDENIFLIMELSYGGDLFDRISMKKRYSEDEAKKVMLQLTDAMIYLHDKNIMHRDLKPENILLIDKKNDCNIKISDFGLAKVLEQDQHGQSSHVSPSTAAGKAGKQLNGAKTFCGTPQYFAPEVLQRQKSIFGHGTYSLEADMWSVGVIMYVLIAGAFPFSEKAIYNPAQYSKYNIKTGVWAAISQEAKDLLSHLLVIDPKQRLTARQTLDHPWFTDVRAMSSTISNFSVVPEAATPVINNIPNNGPNGTTQSSSSSQMVKPISTETLNDGMTNSNMNSPVPKNKTQPDVIKGDLMPPPVAPSTGGAKKGGKLGKKQTTTSGIDVSAMVLDDSNTEANPEGTTSPVATRGRRKRTMAEADEAEANPKTNVRASPRRKIQHNNPFGNQMSLDQFFSKTP
jgi:serine/threonine protein kinase/pSer/pThr/pTyr-binding forkhead associated (FHA) protein